MKTVICCLLLNTLISFNMCKASDNNDVNLIVSGNNNFAFNLYQNVKSKPGNLFFSPYSVSTALSMVYVGSKGTTQIQMADTLQFPGIDNEQFHKSFGDVIKQLNQLGQKGNFELVIANALWGQKDFKFKNDYINLVKTNYDAGLENVDFKQTEAARQVINKWVENKTHDKIKDLIPKGMIDAATRLVLTNAIYFKGKWQSQFKPDQTKQMPFTLLNNEKIDVPMMTQTGRFNYAETDSEQILQLPYINDDLSMLILLPKKIDGIKDLELKLNPDTISKCLSILRNREAQVFIPKFKMTSEFNLSAELSKMGMPQAFTDKADFSGMTGGRDLFISAVVHKAFVEVNEEGTEAAAATGVGMKLTSIGAPPPVFKADHPFIFLIRDNHTGSILFLGRVVNPAAQGD